MAAGDRLPPRTLPVVYVAFAHLSLAGAFLLIALRPEALKGFFYTPRLLAVVHLVTLGWITATTLGATYIVGPLALRMPARATWVDGVACGLYLVSALGVASHFWLAGPAISSYWGIAASGATLLPAAAWVAVRTWRALTRGGAPLPVRLHVACAYGNLLLAVVLGALVAVNKVSPVLPGAGLPHVFAHAHLAAVGWATLMVVGVGYRLLAMLFPASPPPDRPVWATLVLLEGGVLGLTATLMFAHAWARLFAVVTAAGVLVFLGTVAWMRRHPKPPPKKLRKPDFGVLHVLSALVYLLLSIGLGLCVVFHPGWDAWVLTAIWLYGVAGLLGFLAQIIVGVEMRLLPMFAWTEAYAGGGYAALPTSPHAMPLRPLQALSLALWTAGVPLLAYGLCRDDEAAIAAAGWGLLAATGAGVANNARVLRHAYATKSLQRS